MGNGSTNQAVEPNCPAVAESQAEGDETRGAFARDKWLRLLGKDSVDGSFDLSSVVDGRVQEALGSTMSISQ
jgi:hypothetical protein